MDAGGGRRTLRVTGDAGGEDRAVLEVQAGGREVVLRAVDVQVGARRVTQRGDHRAQLGASAVVVEGGVEALVELDVELRRRALPHLLDQRLQRLGPFALETR